MGLTRNTVAEVIKYLPASILSLGYPDRLLEHVDLKGSTLTCVDLIAHEGRERILDLGVLQDIGTFDLVIDSGCIEHVANIANAFINAASSIRVGGHIIHEIPMNMISHGYWNICPSWLTERTCERCSYRRCLRLFRRGTHPQTPTIRCVIAPPSVPSEACTQTEWKSESCRPTRCNDTIRQSVSFEGLVAGCGPTAFPFNVGCGKPIRMVAPHQAVSLVPPV